MNCLIDYILAPIGRFLFFMTHLVMCCFVAIFGIHYEYYDWDHRKKDRK